MSVIAQSLCGCLRRIQVLLGHNSLETVMIYTDKDVARHGAADQDRAGADVDAQPLAGAAAERCRLHRPGAAPVSLTGWLRSALPR
jgi:hypothetical protein